MTPEERALDAVIRMLEGLNIPYMITGSLAAVITADREPLMMPMLSSTLTAISSIHSFATSRLRTSMSMQRALAMRSHSGGNSM